MVTLILKRKTLTVFAFQSNIKVIGKAYFCFPFSDEFISWNRYRTHIAPFSS